MVIHLLKIKLDWTVSHYKQLIEALCKFTLPTNFIVLLTFTKFFWQALDTGSKICYSGGDFTLIACPIGYSLLENRTQNYTSIYCLGDGIWSNPKPVYCTKRICENQPSFPNTQVTVFGRDKEGGFGKESNQQKVKAKKKTLILHFRNQ